METLTPLQRRTVEQLLGWGAPRPSFDPAMTERLRVRLTEEFAALDFEGTLWIGKNRITNAGRCEGLLQADLAGESTFTHGFKSSAGKIAHRAVQASAPRPLAGPVLDLVEWSVDKLREEDEEFATYWESLNAIEASDTVGEAVRLIDTFMATFPPLRPLAPVSEFRVAFECDPIIVSGRVDLVLGRDDPANPTSGQRLLIDLKHGFPREHYAEDMRLYALLFALARGTPPYRVATFFLDKGTWQSEDVSGPMLDRAADRLIDAARTAARLLAGSDPRLTPGSYCSWCPRQTSCPPGAEYLRVSAESIEAE